MSSRAVSKTLSSEPRVFRLRLRGPAGRFYQDRTRLLDFEGALRSGKTTAALWKVLNSCVEHPGMAWLICRWTESDTESKLAPHWRALCGEAGITLTWYTKESYDELQNGSRVYILGLRPSEQTTRYAKLRGLTLGGIYIDQAEEIPHDIYGELKARLSQKGVPLQLLMTPNPVPHDHWIATEFPEDRDLPDHHLYRVSVYDNAQNLSPEILANLEAAFPVGDLRRNPLLLGLRGLSVSGRPVYGETYRPEIHCRPLRYDPSLILYEGIDFGGRHPCVVWAQRPGGGWWFLGGLMGLTVPLDDFIPLIREYRAEWFGTPLAVLTTCDPAGAQISGQGHRDSAVKILQDAGISPQWHSDANSPVVRTAAVERLKACMRRRTLLGAEGFGVEQDRGHWLLVGADGIRAQAWLPDGFAAGYVWEEELRSVAHKPMRLPRKDGWYDHGQNCCEYLETAFGGDREGLSDARLADRVRRLAVRAAQRDEEHDASAIGARRGGYG